MEEQEQIAKYYQETNKHLTEQRRVIDFDMKRILIGLEKDHSLEGNLKVLRYKSEIQQAELAYDDRAIELQQIDYDLRPILIANDSHRNAPFTVKVGDQSFFDSYINEQGEIISTENYTKVF